MRFLFLVFGFTFLPFACSDGPPPPAEAPSDPVALPVPPPVGERDTVVRDQIEHTVRHTPEAAVIRTPLPPPPPTNIAPAAPPKQNSAPHAARLHVDHGPWDELLRKHVGADGRVDYGGFQKDASRLQQYLDRLSEKIPAPDWSREEALAFWINAYNAFTVELILNNWPVRSIRDIDQPWDQKFILLEGKKYSLNQIEHEIVRPTFAEPRIHFALVCAAVSCPPLADRAYTAATVDRMLEARTRRFLNDETFNVTQEAVVRISPLFDWYGEDFGDVKAFVNRYVQPDIPQQKELYFLEYDWELNDR